MKTAALLLAATLMTVGGAWVQAQSTTNLNQTGNHTNNPNDPGQQSDQSDKLDNKGQVIRNGKAAKTRTDKRSRRGKPTPATDQQMHNGQASAPPATLPAVPSIPVAPAK